MRRTYYCGIALFIYTGLFFLGGNARAAIPGSFDFNENCRQAYQQMMSLHFDAAKSLLQAEKKTHPENLIPVYIENYEDFFRCVFDEDVNELVSLEPNCDRRLLQLKQGDPASPYFLFTQAQVQLQWALVHLKFESYYPAFFEIKRAYGELLDNQKEFPSFRQNGASLGLLHALIGTIPPGYQWAVGLLGFSGEVKQGMQEVKEALDDCRLQQSVFLDETRYIYMFLRFALDNDPAAAWTLANDPDFPEPSGNPLACFMKGYYARKAGHNEAAIQILSNRQFGSGAWSIYYLDYLLGNAKLTRLDADANVPLERFLQQFNGLNYVKDAYQKLAWYYLLEYSDYDRYDQYMNACKVHGGKFTDSDKEALAEANAGIAPNITLLKAKLCFDGGYYAKAIGLLAGKSTDDFISLKDKVEFTYRAGRIYHEWGFPDEAIGYYVSTIQLGQAQSYYFAANAALELGHIFEARGNIAKARYYYNLCLSMPNTDYKNSLDQKAKSALNRLDH